MICDSKVSARKKGNINKTVVRPAKLYGMLTVPLTFSKKKQRVRVGRSGTEDAAISSWSDEDR